ncbi:MAG: rod shape-determining protein MreC, partial [Agathobacter sp.]|nr:rod shape-determining protein MreC [Agathobacter sp.]
IFDKANDFRTLSDVLKENEELRAQVDELQKLITDSKLDQYELENLRELLALDKKYPSYEKVAASVIAKDGGNWFSTFTINRGTQDGIEVGMNVISGSGLVGIVTDVGPNYAKVRSIIDDSTNVSAMIATTGDNFNVSGNLQSMNQSMVIDFSGLKDEDDQVKVGDPVVTSYVSDQYQQGILIGYISSIEKNSNNLTKTGTITPVVDFEHLEDVLVITKLKETGE